MQMRTLKIGMSGNDVLHLKSWLLQFGNLLVNDVFDEATKARVAEYQLKRGLTSDGIVGPMTTSRMVQDGWRTAFMEHPADESSPFPNKPSYPALTQVRKILLFGEPGLNADVPTPGGPIQGSSVFHENLLNLNLADFFPQAKQISFGIRTLAIHRKTIRQWRALFTLINQKGLGDLILSCAGSYNPRYVRGSTSTFSSHAFATAVDFNAPWNARGAQPAKPGEKGCLLPIIELLPQFEMYSGIWFSVPDGMHIECTKTDAQLGL